MSALTWLCVFLSVGMLNVQGHKDEIRAIFDDPVADEILQQEDKFHAYLVANNTDGLISMYADDIIAVPDGGPVKEGIKEVSENLDWVWVAKHTRLPDTHIIPLGACKEYVLGIHPSDVSNQDGSTKKLTIAVIWKKVGCEYKIFLEMSNDGY